MTTFLSPEMMEPLLALMPAPMAEALRAITTTIPEIASQVEQGALSPEDASVLLAEAMLPTFQAMAPVIDVAAAEGIPDASEGP